MTVTKPPLSEQLEAWLLSGHQRLERLLVPAFGADKAAIRAQQCELEPAGMRMLPLLGLPRELCDLQTWFSGSAKGMAQLDESMVLSTFFRYLAGPLRYEPYTESAIHKAVPSSRGRYPLAFFFVLAREGTTRAYHYIPEFHALRELPGDSGVALEDGKAALVCVARAWRYVEEYGEFAHVPCVLEAGHARAQAQHLAALLGMAEATDPDRELGRALCTKALEVPLYCVGLQSHIDLDRLPLNRANLLLPRPYPEMEQRFPRLRLFQRCFDGGRSVSRGAPLAATLDPRPTRRRFPGSMGVLGLMRRRTSANDRGLATSVLSTVPAGSFESLIATWNTIRRLRTSSAVEASLSFSLLWLAKQDDTGPNLYCLDAEAPTDQPWRGDFYQAIAQMLPYSTTKYNLSAMTAVFIIQADVLKTVEHFKHAALREIYLAAGAAAQDFSLAAAAHDMFARPMKMMREARIESELSLQGQAVYLVLCGFARSANPTMELA